MRRLRILFLDYTNGIGLGGGQRSLALLLRHLPRERYQPLVACPAGEQFRQLVPATVPVFDLPLTPAFAAASRFAGNRLSYARSLAGSFGTVQALRRLIVENRVDLVHANNFKMHVLASLATAGRAVPVLWHVRDIFPPHNAGLMRLAGRAAQRVLTVSAAVAAQFGPLPNVSVLYNAVELPPCQTAGVETSPHPPVIGYAGRLDAGKGLDTLVHAYLSLRSEHPELRLLIAGEGPERRSIPTHPGIEVMGFQADVAEAWRRMDIAVQPSSQPDSFPRSVIEAMSWGKPVVGAAIGGIPEAIAAEKTGLLFEPGDADGLRARLNTLLRDPSRCRAMGAAGRLRCESLFSIPAQIKQLIRIYEDSHAICHP